MNGHVVEQLTRLKAVEATETIERAFAANRVADEICGYWGAVRQTLGVAGLGLAPDEPPCRPAPAPLPFDWQAGPLPGTPEHAKKRKKKEKANGSSKRNRRGETASGDKAHGERVPLLGQWQTEKCATTRLHARITLRSVVGWKRRESSSAACRRAVPSRGTAGSGNVHPGSLARSARHGFCSRGIRPLDPMRPPAILRTKAGEGDTLGENVHWRLRETGPPPEESASPGDEAFAVVLEDQEARHLPARLVLLGWRLCPPRAAR